MCPVVVSAEPTNMNHIRYALEGNVAVVTLDRPGQLNALSAEMHVELRESLERAQQEGKALLITGSGKAFCAGQDLSERRIGPNGERPDLRKSIETRYKPLILQLRSMRIPTVCAVNGVAAGAGASIAMACDMVLAARSARFILAFVKIGLLPDSGSTFFLPRLIGHARASGLAMTGDALGAEKAAAWGLIWDCVDDDQLVEKALSVAQRMASGPTQAYLRIRAALEGATQRSLVEQIDLERDYLGELGMTDDYREGVEAFMQNRDPRFVGR
jgi:2-(1,2-epoxy-1,2-dihydrophenyl)acetyl-CoA isomerase